MQGIPTEAKENWKLNTFIVHVRDYKIVRGYKIVTKKELLFNKKMFRL